MNDSHAHDARTALTDPLIRRFITYAKQMHDSIVVQTMQKP